MNGESNPYPPGYMDDFWVTHGRVGKPSVTESSKVKKNLSFDDREMPIIKELSFWGELFDSDRVHVELYDGYVFHEAARYVSFLRQTIERMIFKIEKGLHWSAQIEGKDALEAMDNAVRKHPDILGDNDE